MTKWRSACLLPALLFSVSAGSNASAQTLILNGKVSTEKVVDVGGKVYVPLSALPALGIQVSSSSSVLSLTGAPAAGATTTVNNGTGGANQKSSVEGCLNEWLFNGILRMRVTKMAPVKDTESNFGDGWAITAEIKNGTTQTLTLHDVGIIYDGAINLAFADGDSWGKVSLPGWQDKTYTKLPQGTGFLYTFKFFPDVKQDTATVLANPPQKFLLEDVKKVDSGYKGIGFTVPDPSFRVNLTCKK